MPEYIPTPAKLEVPKIQSLFEIPADNEQLSLSHLYNPIQDLKVPDLPEEIEDDDIWNFKFEQNDSYGFNDSFF
jgi:hypothetical protein